MHSKQIFSFQKPHYRPTLALARNFSFRQGNALVFTIVRCAHIDSCSCLAFMLKEYQVCGAVRQQGDEHAHTSSLKHRAPYSCHSAILCGFSLSHKKSETVKVPSGSARPSNRAHVYVCECMYMYVNVCICICICM